MLRGKAASTQVIKERLLYPASTTHKAKGNVLLYCTLAELRHPSHLALVTKGSSKGKGLRRVFKEKETPPETAFQKHSWFFLFVCFFECQQVRMPAGIGEE